MQDTYKEIIELLEKMKQAREAAKRGAARAHSRVLFYESEDVDAWIEALTLLAAKR